MPAKGTVQVDFNRCKACGLCVHFCPKDCFEPGRGMNAMGAAPVRFLEGSPCTACGVCSWVCPDLALRVFRLSEAAS